MVLQDRVRGMLPKKMFYGWYIVGAGGATNFLMLGIVVFGMGVFLETFREEFGWSVTAIALGFSIRSLEQGLLSPVAGFLQDKLGPRKMAIAGLLLVVTGLLMYSQLRNLTMYYVAAGIMALGQSIGGQSAFSLAIMRWFSRKRGRAMGAMNIGNGLGYLGPLAIAALMAAFGWRETLVILAVILLVVGIPLAMVIRPTPEAYGLLPDGEVDGSADDGASGGGHGHGRKRGGSMSGMEVKEAIRTPAFYLLVLTGAVHGFAHSPWNTFQIPILQSSGFSLQAAGLVMALYGGSQIPMRFLIGWLGDALGRRRVYVLSYLCHGLGLIAFAFVSPERLWLMPIYFLVFGVGQAAMHTVGQTIVADYFGTKRFGTLRGLRQSMQLPAAILAPVFAGRMFDINGNYQTAFIILGMISTSGVLWLSLIRRPLWDDLPANKLAALGKSPEATKEPESVAH